MKQLTENVRKCKSTIEVFKSVNIFLNTNKINDKYSQALQRRLKKETNCSKAIQAVFDFILNSEFPTKMHDVRYCRYKGSAIGGMECHSYGHS